MQLLEVPTTVDKTPRQPVQQCGMRGNIPAHTEIIGTADQPVSKVSLPNPIDQNPRREWVIGLGQPASQFQTTTL